MREKQAFEDQKKELEEIKSSKEKIKKIKKIVVAVNYFFSSLS